MIALDTNILARFCVDDPNDPEAAKQRPLAHRLVVDSPRLFVPLTVILELEWVLRAFYQFSADALDLHAQGLDFADALHLLASAHCSEFATFDGRRFARRANRLGVRPAVTVPTA